jgi:hypothetical protein
VPTCNQSRLKETRKGYLIRILREKRSSYASLLRAINFSAGVQDNSSSSLLGILHVHDGAKNIYNIYSHKL